MAHRFELLSAAEMAADDPFSGRGAFLSCQGEPVAILRALDAALGRIVPAVAWEDRGAWVDTRDMPDAAARWQEARGGA